MMKLLGMSADPIKAAMADVRGEKGSQPTLHRAVMTKTQ